jgi:hypothetical protein
VSALGSVRLERTVDPETNAVQDAPGVLGEGIERFSGHSWPDDSGTRSGSLVP